MVPIHPLFGLSVHRGGTNLRVGFIELGDVGFPSTKPLEPPTINGENAKDGRPYARRHLEKSWPIAELLKKDKPEDFFAWVGKCVAQVIQDGREIWPGTLPKEIPIPMGVTFSFPMMLVLGIYPPHGTK